MRALFATAAILVTLSGCSDLAPYSARAEGALQESNRLQEVASASAAAKPHASSSDAALRALLGDWPRWGRTFDDALARADRDGSFSGLKGPLVYEAKVAWRAAKAGERGPVMLRLARVDYPHQSYDGVMFVDWNHFDEWFGARATAEDFAGFLDEDPKAWEMTGLIWPALGDGFSRAAVIVPRLKEHLGDGNGGDDKGSLGGISYRLCGEGRTTEMAEIARVLQPLAKAHPGTSFVSMAKSFTDVARCPHTRPSGSSGSRGASRRGPS